MIPINLKSIIYRVENDILLYIIKQINFILKKNIAFCELIKK
jgi:hypothetical protein